jgi:hypothetical protein
MHRSLMSLSELIDRSQTEVHLNATEPDTLEVSGFVEETGGPGSSRRRPATPN